MKRFAIGELFCGPGGLGLGAKLAGKALNSVIVEHAWANDIDKASCETYKKNVADGQTVVANMPVDQFLESSNLNPIDGLLFGFPCNDFSLVGESKGLDGKFGGLYLAGVKALNKFNPDFFVAENVTGLSSANNGIAMAQILTDLCSAGNEGYHLTVHKYAFERYDVPQKRKRFIITGFKSSLPGADSYFPPKPSDKKITAAEALSGVETILPNNQISRTSRVVEERLKRIQPGQNAWNADLDEYALNVKGARLSNIYRRLTADQPAYTVTGSGGGGTHMYHYDMKINRPLTNRERARLQTFPDDFVFTGSLNEVRKQIGMAVPVKGAQHIMNSIFMHLLAPTNSMQGIDPSLGRFPPNRAVSSQQLSNYSLSRQKSFSFS